MNNRISIVVPVYCVEQYLDRCIQSIVAQTYTELEIILVDDGSPDNCPQICDEWSKKDIRIKVIHQENAGVSAARNAGIRAAQGEYLYFVDSDDWILPDLCEKVMKVFTSYDVDVVIFDCDRVTGKGKILGGTEKLNDVVITASEALKELMRGNINNYVWNKMYKRKVFCDIWFPEGRTFEDIAITYKLLLNAKFIYCLNEKLYYYLMRKGSITEKLNTQNLCDLFLARHMCYLHLMGTHPEAAELIYSKVALCALRLYDRSLWDPAEKAVVDSAVMFLRDNKEKILNFDHNIIFRLYYAFPLGYRIVRLLKHYIGSLLRMLERILRYFVKGNWMWFE